MQKLNMFPIVGKQKVQKYHIFFYFLTHSTTSISPLTTSSYLNSFPSSSPSLAGSVPNQQHLMQTHSHHSQLHGRLSAPNGLGSIPSDDEDIDDDDDNIDENGELGSSMHGNATRDGKNHTTQLNGDKSGKPRKKKTRTVFSRSQVTFSKTNYDP